VREVTRIVAQNRNVLIVDTSNEIAGDGDVPHSCVGLARRLQVRSLDSQGQVMIEGVQNHTPEVMVIDEIGRSSEVEAARTCKQRGVRIIASGDCLLVLPLLLSCLVSCLVTGSEPESNRFRLVPFLPNTISSSSAHGDLRKLIKNTQLRGLVGGIETVTLGDAQAKEEAMKRGLRPSASLNKVKTQRAGTPIFDVIVELRRGELHEWRIISPCAKAVDMILEGSHYLAQQRTRNDTTGDLFLNLVHA
jgi:hypothetical protein